MKQLQQQALPAPVVTPAATAPLTTTTP
jgi:hypothetical protein